MAAELTELGVVCQGASRVGKSTAADYMLRARSRETVVVGGRLERQTATRIDKFELWNTSTAGIDMRQGTGSAYRGPMRE